MERGTPLAPASRFWSVLRVHFEMIYGRFGLSAEPAGVQTDRGESTLIAVSYKAGLLARRPTREGGSC